jgi:hypothetical protein
MGVPADTIERLSLGIDQPCGTRLDAVLACGMAMRCRVVLN